MKYSHNIPSAPLETEYIDWQTNNPFARILCRTRNLIPTLCDGVCWKCNTERQLFLDNKAEKIFQLNRANPRYWAGLEELDFPTLKDITNRLQVEIDQIQQQKSAAY